MKALQRGIGRAEYLGWGIGLALLKYFLDSQIAHAFGQSFSPWRYLLPVPVDVLHVPPEQRSFLAALGFAALPFILLGVTLSIWRLREVAKHPAWCLLFFLPGINLAFFVLIAALPGRKRDAEARETSASNRRYAFFLAATLTGFAGFGLAALCVLGLRGYGWGVFFALPVGMGMAATALLAAWEKQPPRFGRAFGAAALGLLWCGALLLLLAIEGLICLLMALPLALALAAFGVAIGQSMLRPGARKTAAALLWAGSCLLSAPLVAGLERTWPPAAPLYRVDSFVEIDAPPERVWPLVIAFPALEPPSEWMFRAGLAYPIRARIEGVGVGAIRYCEFSTGAFVEPITAWDVNRRLAFRVSANPPPMKELSFFDVHPAHLEGFLVSQQGEFRLEPLDNGRRTRLHGTTWYRHGLEPAGYWRWWSDEIIHRIHLRVLRHIAQRAS